MQELQELQNMQELQQLQKLLAQPPRPLAPTAKANSGLTTVGLPGGCVPGSQKLPPLQPWSCRPG